MEDREARLGTREVNEISPDLLKNTPSNIARLEDVIEQCYGRQKYLAQTRSPSDGSDVRWYFCKVPLAENGESLVSLRECSCLCIQVSNGWIKDVICYCLFCRISCFSTSH